MMKESTKNLVLCAMCAAITCVLAPLSIPMPSGVPISLATFSVMLAGVLLGAKYGTLSQLIYLILGAVGLPVFAGYSSGVGAIVGPTGGYLIGYLALAALSGVLYEHFGKNAQGRKKVIGMVLSMILGTIVLYAFGTAWFVVVTHTTPLSALMLCAVPFLPGDAVKIAAVAVLVPQLEKALKRISPRCNPAA
ncbi:biotin transporter BioY [Caproicibacterium sp. NSD3]